ncbi:hypothetical protein A4A49_56043 [Nicotiana attenuata]|uniref:Uncharacterized protein n=1 Tax=Nicotiana attenuata TaxID=49451 RepID=A0A1J6JW41_NICAT|nr:hypothetical protein A4A49_56043 [Nicotiana attenuata]
METRRAVADFVVLFEKMAGGNNELRERLTKLEALVGNVPEGEELQSLMTRLAYLEAEMARLSRENADLKAETMVLRRAKKCESVNAHEDKGKGKHEAGTSKSKEKGSKFSGYFLCDGPHRVRDCPNKAVLNAMTAAEMRAALETLNIDKQAVGVNAIVAEERGGQGALLVDPLGLIN